MQARSKPHPFFASAPDAEHATRLLEGMAKAVAERRYAEVTVADIVRHARVSKRTFYEHFADKEACFLAAYKALSDHLLTRIAEAALAQPNGDAQLHAATRAYFIALSEQRPLVRAFLSEIHAAGDAAIAQRRAIHRQFAELLQHLVQSARKTQPELRPLTKDMATAIVGGINELVLLHVEEGRADRLSELSETTTQLIKAVLVSSDGIGKAVRSKRARRQG